MYTVTLKQELWGTLFVYPCFGRFPFEEQKMRCTQQSVAVLHLLSRTCSARNTTQTGVTAASAKRPTDAGTRDADSHTQQMSTGCKAIKMGEWRAYTAKDMQVIGCAENS